LFQKHATFLSCGDAKLFTRYTAEFIKGYLFITTAKQTLISLIALPPDELCSKMFLELKCFFSLTLYRTKYTLSLCYMQYAPQVLGSRHVPHRKQWRHSL